MEKPEMILAQFGSLVIIKEEALGNRRVEVGFGSTVVVVPNDYEYDDPRLSAVLETAIRVNNRYHEEREQKNASFWGSSEETTKVDEDPTPVPVSTGIYSVVLDAGGTITLMSDERSLIRLEAGFGGCRKQVFQMSPAEARLLAVQLLDMT